MSEVIKSFTELDENSVILQTHWPTQDLILPASVEIAIISMSLSINAYNRA